MTMVEKKATDETAEKKVEEAPKKAEPSTEAPTKETPAKETPAKEPVVEVLSQPTKLRPDMIMAAIQDKDTRDKMLRDETLEPHIHLSILIIVVFLLALVIMVAY